MPTDSTLPSGRSVVALTRAVRSAAIVVTCDRCGRQSAPCNDAQADDWERAHAALHARQDRDEMLKAEGHEARVVIEWRDMDDGSEHGFCTCGWRGPSCRMAGGSVEGHLASVARALQRNDPPKEA